MLNFKKYLVEQIETTWDKDEEDPNVMDKLIEQIKSDCSKFFNNPSTPLYRGSRRGWQSASIEKPRMDRKPLDSPRFIHDLMDEIAEEKTGYKVRSQSVFCTPDFAKTAGFGTTHIIIPIGDFKIIHAEYDGKPITDLYQTIMHDVFRGYRLRETLTPRRPFNKVFIDAVVEGLNMIVDKSKMDRPTSEMEYMHSHFDEVLSFNMTDSGAYGMPTSDYELMELISIILKKHVMKAALEFQLNGDEKFVKNNIDFDEVATVIKKGLIKSLTEMLNSIKWKKDNDFDKSSELNIFCDKYYLIKYKSKLGEYVLPKLPFKHSDKWLDDIKKKAK